ncbi:50S ribosomal protein L21 [Clostridia bacterium]|nr:50S ribosomal protein L21 [Clostridia bacterium]
MYAVIKTGGKQYKVAPNDEIYVEKLRVDEGKELDIKEVVAAHNGKEFTFDPEKLQEVCVKAKVLKNGRAKKMTVFTYKPKKNQKRKMGHRQEYTKLQILAIEGV